MADSSLDNVRSKSCVIMRLDLVDSDANRLKAMGIFEGQTVELTKRGNPLIVKAAGGRVAVAQAIARQIQVRDAVA